MAYQTPEPTKMFLADVEEFLANSGMSASAFGKAALNDPNFVGDLRAGRAPTLSLVHRIYQFMTEHEAAS